MSVKLLLATGIALAILLAYTLAMGKGGLLDMWNMKRDISAQQEQNERLKQRNRELAGEIVNLQKGTEAIEERARSDMGLIRPDEVFVKIIEKLQITKTLLSIQSTAMKFTFIDAKLISKSALSRLVNVSRVSLYRAAG